MAAREARSNEALRSARAQLKQLHAEVERLRAMERRAAEATSEARRAHRRAERLAQQKEDAEAKLHQHLQGGRRRSVAAGASRSAHVRAGSAPSSPPSCTARDSSVNGSVDSAMNSCVRASSSGATPPSAAPTSARGALAEGVLAIVHGAGAVGSDAVAGLGGGGGILSDRGGGLSMSVSELHSALEHARRDADEMRAQLAAAKDEAKAAAREAAAAAVERSYGALAIDAAAWDAQRDAEAEALNSAGGA